MPDHHAHHQHAEPVDAAPTPSLPDPHAGHAPSHAGHATPPETAHAGHGASHAGMAHDMGDPAMAAAMERDIRTRFLVALLLPCPTPT